MSSQPSKGCTCASCEQFTPHRHFASEADRYNYPKGVFEITAGGFFFVIFSPGRDDAEPGVWRVVEMVDGFSQKFERRRTLHEIKRSLLTKLVERLTAAANELGAAL